MVSYRLPLSTFLPAIQVCQIDLLCDVQDYCVQIYGLHRNQRFPSLPLFALSILKSQWSVKSSLYCT